jgi:hypothetical protein
LTVILTGKEEAEEAEPRRHVEQLAESLSLKVSTVLKRAKMKVNETRL